MSDVSSAPAAGYRASARAERAPAPTDWCAAVCDRDLLLVDGWTLPTVADLPTGTEMVPLGTWSGTPVWGALSTDGPSGLRRVTWLACLGQDDADLTRLAARAIQLMVWRRGHRYCGACRTEQVDIDGQVGLRCPGCGLRSFAKAQPVALVAVWRPAPGGVGTAREVLLAQHTYGDTLGIWALVGGFVDPAETLEDAARREVVEEVGLAVTDLAYVGSEAWGMSGPDVLLTGFIARAADPGAEPVVDGHELARASYFRTDDLPATTVPRPALAGRLFAAIRELP